MVEKFVEQYLRQVIVLWTKIKYDTVNSLVLFCKNRSKYTADTEKYLLLKENTKISHFKVFLLINVALNSFACRSNRFLKTSSKNKPSKN